MTEASRAFVETSPRAGVCVGVIKAIEVSIRPGFAPGRANPWVEVPIYTHLAHSGTNGTDRLSRNHINVLSSDVLVALPGSAGTRSEVALRVGYGHPVILFLGKKKIDGLDAETIRSKSEHPELIHIARSLDDLERKIRTVLPQEELAHDSEHELEHEQEHEHENGPASVESPPPSLTWDPFSQRYELPDLRGQRVLVVGIGGGSDIISAYAVAQLLAAKNPQALVWGNTKRGIDRGLKRISRHIYRVPRSLRPLRAGERTHGTTRIDRSVPRGDRGCPFIFRLSSQLARRMELTTEIDLLRFDRIFAVDTGAYSLLGDRGKKRQGRDRKMLAVLQRCHAPVQQITLGPGCVGESSFPVLSGVLGDLAAGGYFLGCFPLTPIFDIYRKLGAPLKPARTPNVLLAIHDNRLEAGPQPGTVIVPRATRPVIPARWLLHGFVVSSHPSGA